jgi:hypothetical protein
MPEKLALSPTLAFFTPSLRSPASSILHNRSCEKTGGRRVIAIMVHSRRKEKTMNARMMCAAAGLLAPLALAFPATAMAQGPVSYEEQLAKVEDQLVYHAPIAGIQNNYWFDYQTDLAEARHELTKDLRGSSDAEDNRDAWEEYRAELADARGDYAKEMAEKGYRTGQVRVLTDTGR